MKKQKVTVNLGNFKNEFEMTCAAQDGDNAAWLALWNHYKNMMMSRLVAAKGFSRSELESEACDVFLYRLKKFNREKVTSKNSFSMFAWLYCGVLNRTNKLIRQRKKDVHLYVEDVNASRKSKGGFVWPTKESYVGSYTTSDDDKTPFEDALLGVTPEIYNVYNPEKLVVDSLHEDDTVRVKNFYNKLSQFERDILEARRDGLTLAQVATKFCCSISTIKTHITRAKRYANDVFQVCYA